MAISSRVISSSATPSSIVFSHFKCGSYNARMNRGRFGCNLKGRQRQRCKSRSFE
ncbi:unnamed protein product [Cuscuta europaea]|uniref:Uncharacterized protein n=1 Tax=Cuscuta europaea TaxID=41803 RepID=A0A9P0YUA4_CUSEU|nr:unnamed protein product [Cuscuta europaea]